MQVRCPLCHNRVEVLDDASLADVVCPSCGSQFSFFNEETATYSHTPTQRVAHFELIERLGMGHFGTVWKARDTELDRTVAVKLPRKYQLDATETEQFLREARAAAQLKHPHIVSIHEVGRDGDTVYIVSDFVRGATLSDWLMSQPFSARDAARTLAKVARALDHAHELGVVHRDLKPGNIMIDLDGEPHVMDFGLAKREAGEVTMTVDGKVLGTPAYMPPEQARGEGHHADRRSDVYSLGVVLFQALTGELPFRGNARMLLVQILNDEPPSPRRLNANVPRDLETITLKCLEKSPQRRYQSARELAEDLERWLERKPISARRPISTTERCVKWTRRHPAVAGSLAAVLLVTVVGFSAVLAMWRRADAERDRAELATENHRRTASQEAAARQDAEQRRQEAIEALAAAEQARQETEAKRIEARRHAALAALERSRSFFEQATPDSRQGMLWLGRSLQYAPEDDRNLQQAIWANLVGWLPNSHTIKHVLSQPGYVTDVAFSPSGNHIATTGEDHRVRLWDFAAGTLTWQSDEFALEAQCVTFSPDGKWLLAGFGNAGYQWKVKGPGLACRLEAATGKLLGELIEHSEVVSDVAIHPDGRQFVTACWDKHVRIWDSETGTLIGKPLAHPHRLMGVIYSPDGKQLAVSSSQSYEGGVEQEVWFWDAATAERLPLVLKHPNGVKRVSYSPDGKLLLTSCNDKCARLWQLADGKLLRTFPHQHSVPASAFSPDGQLVITAGHDYRVRLWNSVSGVLIGEPLLESGFAKAVEFHPDGRHFLATSSRDVRVWELGTIRRPEESRLGAAGIARSLFSPDATRVAIARGRDGKQFMLVYDVASGEPVGPELPLPSLNWNAIDFSPDKQVVVTGGEDRKATAWRIADGVQLGVMSGHTERVESIACSPDGRTIATGSDDMTIRLWNAETYEPLGEPLKDAHYINSLAFLPDSRRLLSGTRSLFQSNLWDLDQRQTIAAKVPHNGALSALVVSSDGKRFAAACWGVRTVRWYYTETGQPASPPMQLAGLDISRQQMDVSGDGRTLATANARVVRLWDAHTGQPLGPALPIKGDARAAAFSADGQYILALDASGVLRRWRSLPPLDRSAEALQCWTCVLTGMQLDEIEGADLLTERQWRAQKEKMESLGGAPADFALSANQVRLWHEGEAAACQAAQQWYAAAWHTERVLNEPAKDSQQQARRWYEAALCYRAADRLDDYRRLCARFYERCRDLEDPDLAEQAAWLCKFGEQAVEDLNLPLQLVDKALAAKPKSPRYHNTRGSLLYRLGRYEEAIEELKRTIALRKAAIPQDGFFLSMAYARSGNAEQARHWQAEARSQVAAAQTGPDGKPRTLAWNAQLEHELFEREAEQVLRETP